MSRLLLVDDEATIVEAMRQYFARLGFAVDVAEHLCDALAMAARHRYLAAITDLRLDDGGEAGGLQVARAIKAFDGRTRVVLLTAYRSSEIDIDARAAGVDAILSKPLPLSEVARVVAGLCMQGTTS